MELFLLFKPKLQRFIWAGLFLLLTQAANAQVSGTVFRDFNANGIKDNSATFNEPFVAGVTVTAYDAAGTPTATTTDASGAYSFTGLTLPLRIEFSGYQTSDYTAPAGSTNNTSVQFYTAASSAANFGVNYPSDYCHSNPKVATTILYYGGVDMPLSTGKNVLATLNYNDQFTAYPHIAANNNATTNQLGSIWGIAYQKETKYLFTSAFVKRHADVLNDNNGNEKTGAIYLSNYSGGGSPSNSLFVDVNNIGINTGTFSRSDLVFPVYPGDQYGDWICDAMALDKVGKMGIGDIDISEDDRYLFFTNLFDRKLYRLEIGNPATVPTAVQVTAYNNAPWLNNPAYTCSNGVARPFATKFYRGKIYVGVVCTAENGGTLNDLNARVFELNPATNTWTTTPILDIPLNYTKGAVWEPTPGNKIGTKWNPWIDQLVTFLADPAVPESLTSIYPQPILSDIEFDIDGSMILGFMDRNGHTTGGTGTRAPSSYPPPSGSACTADPAFSYGPYVNAMSGGDLLRVYYNKTTNTYVLENNATAGTVTTNGAGNGEGPGGGEFYYQDSYAGDPSKNHDEVVQGGLALLPGANQIVVTSYDPLDVFYSGGLQWHDNNIGNFKAGFQLYSTQNDPTTFGKANGLGDIEIMCNPAPLEIGNRVWDDTNSDGIQDAGEAGIDGITVQLYEGATLVGTTTTVNGGQWYFNDANVTGDLKFNTAYTIRVPSA